MAELNITGSLLKKYHSGLCSATEIATVEAWLELDDCEIVGAIYHQKDEEAKIENILWSTIEKSTITAHKRAQRNKTFKRFGYVIAASLLVTMFALTYFSAKTGNTETQKNIFVKIEHTEGTFKAEHNVKGLVLMPLSNRITDVSRKKAIYEKNNLPKEAIIIRNESDMDIGLQFVRTGTLGSSKIVKQRNFICKKGITYVAIHPDINSSEFILVDMRYMEDVLPLHLAMKLNRELQFI